MQTGAVSVYRVAERRLFSPPRNLIKPGGWPLDFVADWARKREGVGCDIISTSRNPVDSSIARANSEFETYRTLGSSMSLFGPLFIPNG